MQIYLSLYISLPSLHDFDMKLRVYFHLLGMTRMHDNDLRFLFLNFDKAL